MITGRRRVATYLIREKTTEGHIAAIICKEYMSKWEVGSEPETAPMRHMTLDAT